MIKSLAKGAPVRLWSTLAAAAALWAAAFSASAEAAAPGRLIDLGAPQIVGVETGNRRISFSESTKGGMLVTIMDDYTFEIRDDRGDKARVVLNVIATANTLTPFADESEADVRNEVKESATSGAAFVEAARIDGAWFEELGFGPSGTRKSWDSILYSGHRHDVSFLITAAYLSKQISTETVRTLVRTMTFEETTLGKTMAEYKAMLASAVSPAGMTTGFGSFPLSSRKGDALDEMYAMRLPGVRSAAAPVDGYYRIEYDRGRNGWMGAMCMPDGGLRREAFEEDLLPGGDIKDLRTLSPLQTPAGEIRRHAFVRIPGYGKPVSALAWTAHRDGTIFHVFSDADAPKRDVEALVAAVSDPSRRCEPWPERRAAPATVATGSTMP
jgi:hypothetical protein